MTEVRSLAELITAFETGLEVQLEDSGPQRALLTALPFEDRPLSSGALERLAPPQNDTRSTVELIVDEAVEAVAQALYYEGLEEVDQVVREVVRRWNDWDVAPVGAIGVRGRHSALAEARAPLP